MKEMQKRWCGEARVTVYAEYVVWAGQEGYHVGYPMGYPMGYPTFWIMSRICGVVGPGLPSVCHPSKVYVGLSLMSELQEGTYVKFHLGLGT